MKKVTFSEALLILLVMIIILGSAVIKFGLSPETPVLFVIALLILWAKCHSYSWDEIHAGIIIGSTSADPYLFPVQTVNHRHPASGPP